jgi:hypothetical protein
MVEPRRGGKLVKPALRHAAACLVAVALSLPLAGCKEDYRIGEYVWVEWEGRDYPAYLIEQKSKGRFRVHYDGYDPRWDEDVTLERIKGRIQGPVNPPPPPEKVARAMGLRPQPDSSAGAPSTYNVGDRVRVRWRGSTYTATIQAMPGPGKLLVHYEGYGSEWDEVVPEDRIVGKR